MSKLSVIVAAVHLLSVSATGQTVGDSIKNRIFENLVGEIKTIGEFGVLIRKLKLSPEELSGFPILFPIRIDASSDIRITSGYGRRIHPVKNIGLIHKGVDIAASRGTPVYCAGDGTVRRARYEPGYGWFVEVEHQGGFSTLYGHLDKV